MDKNRFDIRPLVKFSPAHQRYMCHDDHYIYGFSLTPMQAWIDWKIKEQRRTRIARRGVWNIQSCRTWFYEGCWRMRFYVGGLQVVGYIPHSDELILRG